MRHGSDFLGVLCCVVLRCCDLLLHVALVCVILVVGARTVLYTYTKSKSDLSELRSSTEKWLLEEETVAHLKGMVSAIIDCAFLIG